MLGYVYHFNSVLAIVCLVFSPVVLAAPTETLQGSSNPNIRSRQPSELRTVTQVAKENSSLSKLSTLLRETELGFKLDRSRDTTFFMPTNNAIEEYAFDQLEDYLTYDERLQMLQAHIIPEIVKLAELSEGVHEFDSLEGTPLRIEIVKRKDSSAPSEASLRAVVSVRGSSETTELDNNAKIQESVNGVSYVVPKLLIPPQLELVIRDAKKKLESGKTPQSVLAGADDQAFGVPEHVKETNRLHWIEKDAVAPTTVEAAPPVATAFIESNPQVEVGVLNRDQEEVKSVDGLLGQDSVQLL